MTDDPARANEPRRTLLGAIAAGLVAAVAAVVSWPALRLIAHPLSKRTVHGGEEPIAVAELSRLPEGVPVRATVIAPARFDAWTRFDHVPLGAVWLLRRGDSVTAFSTVCPHAGCFVDFDAKDSRFSCPCHGSHFGLDGERAAGPSPRALDTLETQILDGKVLVRYQRFRQAQARKEPA